MKPRKMLKLMIVCILISPAVFHLADMERGYNATGGEIFIFLLPILAKWVMDMVKEIGGERQ